MKTRILLLSMLLFVVMTASAQEAPPPGFYLGVDLSYVNEMEDCGAVYQVAGEARDPYQLFADYGANLVRVRLWHTPDWTEYSNFDDVVRSLQRAKDAGMDTLLDFHYSDTWADPSKQIIPAAWINLSDSELSDAVYDYTLDVLTTLDAQGLMPTIVQVGNEINSEVMRPENTSGYPINWQRNATLINRGIQAVRDAGAQSSSAPRIMLHIAQPEEVEGWLLAATEAGVTDYDIIGISYYPGWSTHTIKTTGNIIRRLRHQFGKDVLIAETAYPWTLTGVSESAGNIMGQDFLQAAYPATPEGQQQFLVDLTQTVFNNGGSGIVYWEPAWVSTDCHTLWGQGSHWENGTFFDFDGEVLPGIEFLQHAYAYPVSVTLEFRFEGKTSTEPIYFRGDFTGMGRRLITLTPVDGVYTVQTRLPAETVIGYQFYGVLPASDDTALLPADCRNEDGYTTVTIPAEDAIIEQTDASCPG